MTPLGLDIWKAFGIDYIYALCREWLQWDSLYLGANQMRLISTLAYT